MCVVRGYYINGVFLFKRLSFSSSSIYLRLCGKKIDMDTTFELDILYIFPDISIIIMEEVQQGSFRAWPSLFLVKYFKKCVNKIQKHSPSLLRGT